MLEVLGLVEQPRALCHWQAGGDHRGAVNRAQILDRAHRITRENLAILSDWVEAEPLISWVKPQAGTTALLKYDLPLPSRDFCTQLLEEEGVLFTPGSAMDMEGWLRIGFANSTADLRDGLARVSAFLARHGAAQSS